MISVQRASKRYGPVVAVDDVSIDVPKGQVVGILGPNGAGKTTTIRMIAGLLPPTAGRVLVDDHDAIAQTMDVRRRLGYLPESNPLYPEMRVRDYLAYRGRLFGLRGSALRNAANAAIERCWLSDVVRKRVAHLSKGYRQRVGLASALIHDPPVLILDEPTSGLDPAQIAETRNLIRDLAGERTMLIVSHILPEVEKTCDRIVIFARGRIRADGAPSDLIAQAAQKGGDAGGGWIVQVRGGADSTEPPKALKRIEHAKLLDCTPAGDGWLTCRLSARAGAADLGEVIGQACASANLVIRELRPDAVSLEQLYIRLIEDADRATPDPRTAAA